MKRLLLPTVTSVFMAPFTLQAAAAAGKTLPGPLLGATLTTGPGGHTISAPMQIVILLTFLTLLPAALMCITPFLRISIVLHFLRQALGTQTAPSNQVLIGLGLFLSILVMQPVAKIYSPAGLAALRSGQAQPGRRSHARGNSRCADLSWRFAREKDIQLFVNIAHAAAAALASGPRSQNPDPGLHHFFNSRPPFRSDSRLFFSFMVIDVVIASITVSMGMMQLPPVMLSAPFKIRSLFS